MLEFITQPQNLTFLLLPVAAGTAYLWGARASKNSRQLNHDYFQALNDLLSDKTDRAIEAFSRLAESKQDEVNLHLALGLLFRRRGELDRAIYVHHRILKNTALSEEDKLRAQLALADNYYRSGLLDRAEALLLSIIDNTDPKNSDAILAATKQLLSIFEQQKDWDRAIEQAKKLENTIGITLGKRLAHYHNELANLAEDDATHGFHIEQALMYQPDAPRPIIDAISFHIDQERAEEALLLIDKVAKLHPWVLPQIAYRIMYAFENRAAFIDFLKSHLQKSTSPRLHALLAEIYRNSGNESEALATLDEALAKAPAFLLIQTLLRTDWSESVQKEPRIAAMLNAAGTLLNAEAKYQCSECGVTLIKHRWQCPGCHHWDAVKPLADIVPIPYQRPSK